eukprot:15473530-Alexandrium_andersonii.AAC.1
MDLQLFQGTREIRQLFFGHPCRILARSSIQLLKQGVALLDLCIKHLETIDKLLQHALKPRFPPSLLLRGDPCT